MVTSTDATFPPVGAAASTQTGLCPHCGPDALGPDDVPEGKGGTRARFFSDLTPPSSPGLVCGLHRAGAVVCVVVVVVCERKICGNIATETREGS